MNFTVCDRKNPWDKGISKSSNVLVRKMAIACVSTRSANGPVHGFITYVARFRSGGWMELVFWAFGEGGRQAIETIFSRNQQCLNILRLLVNVILSRGPSSLDELL